MHTAKELLEKFGDILVAQGDFGEYLEQYLRFEIFNGKIFTLPRKKKFKMQSSALSVWNVSFELLSHLYNL